ncbi:MAG: PLP-dependent cysteine synthase family protein, partial [Acidiferrobacteraceae bacterium]|nr:PLP-dependent cysteine synthase family protein [Acidiferrobacteraceae bacterium]
MKYQNILQTIGATPVIRLNSFNDHQASALWVKLESFNPGGSVKDRPALNMIEDAEQRGVLNPGDTIVEPTSGNTGIGLAMVAAVRGYPAVFVMSEDMSEERKAILRAYGAQVILTPADKGTVGAIEEARRLEKEKGYFFVGQHFNPANPASHHRTAQEIVDDFGKDLKAVICTTGTGGTISGLSKVLRKTIPGIAIIATEPDNSPILSKGVGCRHRIMGTAPGFIPDTLDQNSYDDIIPINADQAIATSRRLAEREGIFCGISCGAAVLGMLDYAQRDVARDQQ